MHIPVLLNEVLEILKPARAVDNKFIDATIGQGGHAKALLSMDSDVRILGLDLDERALERLRQELSETGLGKRCLLVYANYRSIKQVAYDFGFTQVAGILLDLGFSSLQLDEAERGFSFQTDGRLDMRYDLSAKLTAERIVNHYPQPDLEKIFKDFGEERFSRRIAANILFYRSQSPITRTLQLFAIIKEALPSSVRHRAADSARRVFQALRVEVNHELENLTKSLPQMVELLKPGGRIVVISFHSLEDRIVKHFFRLATDQLQIITKKPITPTLAEQLGNPRSRSAKLRAAERMT